ncbi:hypothetical protein H2200_003530 [Cladophialophora chaetospira]|uniref:Uncharacterized protein n=1 Tax=Cladophialophora chaetospira TaxID=386627 RepID=A0AA38XHI5_9EURO|nr:hypothetical protein H2200_003530 [Cladophialophora chaetospira]
MQGFIPCVVGDLDEDPDLEQREEQSPGGTWKREKAAFELSNLLYSPAITIIINAPVEALAEESPVLIPAQHLSLATLAVCGLHQTPTEDALRTFEIYFYGKNGQFWLSGRKPTSVEELHKKVFIWLGKYATGVGTHWGWSGGAPSAQVAKKRDELDEEIIRAVSDTAVYRDRKSVEEAAIYTHLRGFVVEMEAELANGDQLAALSRFQALAQQMSMAAYRVRRTPIFEQSFSAEYVDRLNQLYAYAGYQILALNDPVSFGWNAIDFHKWCIDRVAAIGRAELWDWRADLLFLEHSVSLMMTNSFPPSFWMQGLFMLSIRAVPDDVHDAKERQQHGMSVIQTRFEHLPIYWDLFSAEANVDREYSEEERECLLKAIEYLRKELSLKYGSVAQLKDQPWDKNV